MSVALSSAEEEQYAKSEIVAMRTRLTQCGEDDNSFVDVASAFSTWITGYLTCVFLCFGLSSRNLFPPPAKSCVHLKIVPFGTSGTLAYPHFLPISSIHPFARLWWQDYCNHTRSLKALIPMSPPRSSDLFVISRTSVFSSKDIWTAAR